MDSKDSYYRTALVFFPWESQAPYKFLSDLITIITSIIDNVTIIGGNTNRLVFDRTSTKTRDIGYGVHYVKNIRPLPYSIIFWIYKFILIQIYTSYAIFRERKNIDLVLFYMAYPYYFLPLLTAKILSKKTIEVVTRTRSKTKLDYFFLVYDKLLFKLLDWIVPESEDLIELLELKSYSNKIIIDGSRFIDRKKYSLQVKYSERKLIIGYVGRLVKEKGIIEFIKSIPLIYSKFPNSEFLISGSGDLSEWVQQEIRKIEGAYEIKIRYCGWIGENLSEILNELKILVHPSYYDALPTIIFEAMACGTPVLVFPIGAIPKFVINSKTGFILSGHLANDIFNGVSNILENDNIDINNVILNAEELINNQFSYEAAVLRYRRILKSEK